MQISNEAGDVVMVVRQDGLEARNWFLLLPFSVFPCRPLKLGRRPGFCGPTLGSGGS